VTSILAELTRRVTFKVLQFVHVENKMQVLLDLAVAAWIPIVTRTPNTIK
jgi:hypothetical protein